MRCILIFITLFSSTLFFGQYSLFIEPVDDASKAFFKRKALAYEQKDSIEAELKLKELGLMFRDEGYLTYQINKMYAQNRLIATVSFGSKFEFAQLSPGNCDLFILGEIGIQANDFEDPWSFQRTRQLIENLLSYYEENGYPFARAKLDSLDLNSNILKAQLNVFSGPYRNLDSIVVKTDTKIPKGYISYHLGLKTGKPYNERKLRDVEQLALNEGTFSANRPPQVLFEEQKTSAFLYLAKQNNNRISGIAGINTNEDGSVFLTGELDLSLNHIFKGAENIAFNWNAPRAGSQQLNLSVDIPYLFKSPLGIIFNFNLFREDTLFSNRDVLIGLNLRPNARAELGVSYQDKNSNNLQGADNFANVTTKYVLLTTKYNRLNHRFLPTKGVLLKVLAGQGDRQSQDDKQRQYTAMIQLSSFFTIHKMNKMFVGLKAEGLFNSTLVTNELYRIGGVNSIRGFNEQSIFASQYAFSQVEYRLFLERLTYFFLFADVGFSRNEVPEIPTENFLIGTGLGFSFYTKGGIFSLAIGVGKQNENPFNLSEAKVHIGYVNRF
jgi:outer membrane protein assembly factor BamA